VKINQLHIRVSHKLLTLTMIIVVMFSCEKDAGEQDPPQIPITQLQIIESYSLDVKEPSGLCKSWNENEFLIVSDNSNTIFRISDEGLVLEELPFKGNDLEGITYQEAGKIIWVVNEEKNTLSKLNKSGVLQQEYELDYQSHPSNKGLEGITVNTINNHLFMLNEASPGLLLEFFNGEIVNSIPLGFAPDYSGLFFHEETNQLWIISDEAKMIYQCSIKGELINSFQHTVDKAEGIIVNTEEQVFWLCSDSEDKLYKLSAQ